MNKNLNEQQLKSICDVLAHTDKGLSKTEATNILHECNITIVGDGSSSDGNTS
jgi:hypothetical protein